MPAIKFTDTNLRTLSADKTTWFTDPDVKGLRLCVTSGGTKSTPRGGQHEGAQPAMRSGSD